MTELWVLGIDDTGVERRQIEAQGWATVSSPLARRTAQADGSVATLTVTRFDHRRRPPPLGIPDQHGLVRTRRRLHHQRAGGKVDGRVEGVESMVPADHAGDVGRDHVVEHRPASR